MADPANKQVVIVAIPSEDDYVWKVSSEKIPHMTLLYLGETEVTQQMANYVEHAASLKSRFGMNVDRRGKLGENDADVLFFSKGWGFKEIADFRAQLLQNQEINKAYQSAVQFPEWTPHLTLGFPETPAKPMTNRDYGIGWVDFDRIAIWTGDSEGPTYLLDPDRGMEVAMSTLPTGSDLDEILEHYGVKGMKWGVRKRSRQTESDSEDASRVVAVKSRAKAQKTTRIFTNEELEAAIKRMKLEQDFSKLSGGIDKTQSQKAKMFIAKLLGDAGKQGAQSIANNETKTLFENTMRKAKAGR